MEFIKVAIVDDHRLFRKGLVSLLEIDPKIKIQVEASSGIELLEKINGLSIDVILMDIEMPGMDGIEATKRVRESFPDVRVVIMSAHNDEEMILHAIEQGAKGYLLKDTDPDELLDAISTVMQNGFCFNKDISHLLLKGIVDRNTLQSTFANRPQFTERELDVLNLICREMTNAEIGDKLFLSSRTVEGYRQRMIEKISARNTVGLVIFAFKNKLMK